MMRSPLNSSSGLVESGSFWLARGPVSGAQKAIWYPSVCRWQRKRRGNCAGWAYDFVARSKGRQAAPIPSCLSRLRRESSHLFMARPPPARPYVREGVRLGEGDDQLAQVLARLLLGAGQQPGQLDGVP